MVVFQIEPQRAGEVALMFPVVLADRRELFFHVGPEHVGVGDGAQKLEKAQILVMRHRKLPVLAHQQGRLCLL